VLPFVLLLVVAGVTVVQDPFSELLEGVRASNGGPVMDFPP